MTAAENVVEKLLQLGAPDRSWILERLSDGERAQLALAVDGSGNLGETPASEEYPQGVEDQSSRAWQQRQDRAISILASASPEAITHLLKKESAWIVHALSQEHNWPWERPVLAALPSDVRHELNRFRQAGSSVSRPVVDALVRIAGEKIGGVQVDDWSSSAFEVVMGKVRRTFVRRPFFGIGRE